MAVIIKKAAAILSILAAVATKTSTAAECNSFTPTTLDFIFKADNANHAAIEDDIRADLAKVGITLAARPIVDQASENFCHPNLIFFFWLGGGG